MQNLQLGFDAHVLDGKHQGTRTTLGSLLKAIAKLKNVPDITIYSENTPLTVSLLENAKFKYKDLPKRNGFQRLLFTFPNLFRRDQIDCGVFQYVAPLYGRNIVFIHDILPISHPHLFPFSMRLKALLLFKLSIRRATKIIVVSKFTKSQIEKRLRISANKIAIVRNGPSFDRAVYLAPPTAVGKKYILTVGRIEKRKNIPLLVEAFVRANLKEVSLVIVGAPDGGFDYQFPPNENILLLKNIDDATLIETYRKASLFVYPSSAEGFGIPLLDAILFGLPVLSSNKCSMPEVGEDLVEYFDPDGDDATSVLQNRLTSHFDGTKIIACPTVEQRKDHLEAFSWNRAACNFIEAIKDLEVN